MKRDLNREVFELDEIEKDLSENTLKRSVFNALADGLRIRSNEKAFSPLACKRDFHISDKIWSFLRIAPHNKSRIIILYNISNENISTNMNEIKKSAHINENIRVYDL